MAVFVDASAWLVLADARERRHRIAKSVLNDTTSGTTFVTSDYVFDEVLTRGQRILGPRQARALGGLLWAEEHAALMKVDIQDLEVAWRMFQKYDDKGLSFTDCTILAQMDRYGLDTIFTFDQGFEKVGKTIVPSAST